MKKRLAFIFIITLLTACSTQQAVVPPAPSTTPEWMYVISADHANMSKNAHGQDQLQLYPVQNIRSFTDRPLRNVKTLSAKEFMQIWTAGGKNSYQMDHPNAAFTAILEGISHQKVQDEMVILSHPIYDATHSTLSFTVQKMTQKETLTSGTLQYATLFID